MYVVRNSALSAAELDLVHGGRSRYRPVETVKRIGRGLGRAGEDTLQAVGNVVKQASKVIGKVVGAIGDLFD